MRDNFVAPVNVLDDLLGGGAPKPVGIRIADIRRDGATQPRAGLDNQHVEDLIQALTEGATLPAIDLMFDGTFYWVYDGFHRIAAHERLGRVQIQANIHQGAQGDAQWESYAVNKSHGLKRSNEDKKRQVTAALRHPKGATLSNSQIAKHVGVDEKTVRFYREQLESASEIPKVTERTGADGKTYNTAKIGTRPAPPVVAAKPVYTPVTIAGNSEPTPGTPIPPRGAASNTPAPEAVAAEITAATAHVAGMLEQATDGARAAIVSLDDLPVVASVTAPCVGPDPDEAVVHPLDCYDDAQATPYVGKMHKLHELKMWLRITRDQKVKEYQKLTGWPPPAMIVSYLDTMILGLEQAMDAVEREAAADANQ